MSINWIPPSSAFLTNREMEVDQQVPVCAMSLTNLVWGTQSILVATMVCPQFSHWMKLRTPSQKEHVHDCMDERVRVVKEKMGGPVPRAKVRM